MSNYLLIHGAYHGAWVWKKVKKKLEDQGHFVHTFDLPGSGHDQTLRKEINLDTYKDFVVDYVQKKGLKDLIIVGHSMAGGVLSKIAGPLKNRIKTMVFLAAMVVEDGCPLIDFIPDDRRDRYVRDAAKSSDNTIEVPFIKPGPDVPKEKAERIIDFHKKLSPQAFGVYTQPIDMQPLFNAKFEKVYIICTKDRAFPYQNAKDFSDRLGGKLIEIETGHNAMLSAADELVEVLENLS